MLIVLLLGFNGPYIHVDTFFTRAECVEAKRYYIHHGQWAGECRLKRKHETNQDDHA